MAEVEIELRDNQLFFDDYMEDQFGTPVEFLFPNGKRATFQLKDFITVEDRERATKRSLKKHIDNSGNIVIDMMDENLFQLELVKATILSWPFVDRNGHKVAVTDATVRKLPPHVYDAIVKHATGSEQQQKAQIIPFESSSEQA